MAVPLPSPADTNLDPPDPDEVRFISRGLSSAVRRNGALTELQTQVFEAVTEWLDRYVRDGAPLPDLEPRGR